jgi:hypothetical protein
MSLLEDLIGDLSTISDEDLEEAIVKGRLAREYTEPAKEKKIKVPKSLAGIEVNMDDFD